MSDHGVPEAFQTANVYRRSDARTGTVVFNPTFAALFKEFDEVFPAAYARSLEYDVTDFPEGNPLYTGVRIPGTQFAIGTQQLLLRLDAKGQVARRTQAHELSLGELTQLVDALHNWVSEKRR